MSTPLKQFTGFHGVAAMAQLGDVQFFLLAANPRQLDILWSNIMSVPLDQRGVQKAVLVAASLLPDAPIRPINPIPPITPIIPSAQP